MLQRYPLITTVWEKNRSLVVIIGVLLLFIFIIFVGQRWLFEPKLIALRTEQSNLQKQVRQRQMEFSSSGVPLSAAEQINKNLQKFNSLIPLQDKFSGFIGQLFDWAQRSGLDIHQVKYQHEDEKEVVLLRYGLSFSVKGSYSQIKKFIYLLENSQRILVLKKIMLSISPSEKGDNRRINLRIELDTYFRGKAA